MSSLVSYFIVRPSNGHPVSTSHSLHLPISLRQHSIPFHHYIMWLINMFFSVGIYTRIKIIFISCLPQHLILVLRKENCSRTTQMLPNQIYTACSCHCQIWPFPMKPPPHTVEGWKLEPAAAAYRQMVWVHAQGNLDHRYMPQRD